jgi:hypothetical protein
VARSIVSSSDLCACSSPIPACSLCSATTKQSLWVVDDGGQRARGVGGLSGARATADPIVSPDSASQPASQTNPNNAPVVIAG